MLVNTFWWDLMKFVENMFESPVKEIVFFSDGSAAQ
jgi:hypothetical protein